MEKGKSPVLEVCAGSYEDCLAAARGGAKRVELNSALSVGGLTPSVTVLKKVKEDTPLEVICMVRDRAAGFCYSEMEKQMMFEQAGALLEAGADGIAFGFLKKDGSVDTDSVRQMVELIHSYGPEKTAVFHRAFDVTPDPVKACEILIGCGADRILTSGAAEKAIDGMEMIRDLQADYGDRIEILAGSGVNASNAAQILKECRISQLHSSCKSYRMDPTTAGSVVSYSYLPEPHTMDYDIVSEELVRELAGTLDSLAG